jgi:hypothetical protein
VVGRALIRILAGLAAAVEERPVARLHGEELAGRTLRGSGGELPPLERAQQPQLESTRRPREVRDLRRVPGAEVLGLAPR